MTADIQGHQYAKVDDVKAGDTVTVDGDFTCMAPWSQHVVQADKDGLFIACGAGGHDLSGQIDDNGEYYLGIYSGVVEAPPVV